MTEEYQTPMSIMREQMQARAAARVTPYRVHVSNAIPFFDLRDYRFQTFLGSFSWTCPVNKEKWIAAPHARDIGAGVWVTPGDIARDYLAIKYPGRRRITTEQYNVCVKQHTETPLYADPCSLYDGAVYFDLESAYWQIVRACGWDCEYLPGAYLGVQSSMVDFPFRFEKLARNCLVSIGNSRDTNLWTGYEIKFRRQKNQFANRVLWRLVCDVLNGIAYDVIKAGARYVHTDGYICSGTNSRAVAEAIAEWGVKFGVRYYGAFGTIRAAGSYSVGDYQSLPFRQSTRHWAINKVYDPGVKWLRPRFRSFTEIADQDWAFYKGVEGYDD